MEKFVLRKDGHAYIERTQKGKTTRIDIPTKNVGNVSVNNLHNNGFIEISLTYFVEEADIEYGIGALRPKYHDEKRGELNDKADH